MACCHDVRDLYREWGMEERIRTQTTYQVPRAVDTYLDRCLDRKVTHAVQDLFRADPRIDTLVRSLSTKMTQEVDEAAQQRVKQVVETSSDSIRRDIHKDATHKLELFMQGKQNVFTKLDTRITTLENDNTPFWFGVTGVITGGLLGYAASQFKR